MAKTRLFIENHEIELNELVQFCLNKQFEELSNPTTIINDWSKTISVPFTAHNNKVFGYLYKPERMIYSDGDPHAYQRMGIFFDPTKKLDFRLEFNSVVLMIGYAKVNEIKLVAGKGTYEITLFGQLGKIFQEMSKITFDKSVDDSTYLIKGDDYVASYINKELVDECWQSAGQDSSILLKVTDNNYKITDIIGFSPNNAYSDGFDYNSMQTSSTSTITFDEWFGDAFKTDTGVDLSNIIPNGISPRAYGEYRSYLQIPYIYWNKLFQMFQAKTEAITGYTFELDESWFNESNPYWYKLVYILKRFSNEPVDTFNNNYKLGYLTDSLYWGSANYSQSRGAYFYPVGGVMQEEIPIYYIVEIESTVSDSWNTDIYSAHINETMSFKLKYLTFYKDGTYRNTKLGNNNGLKLNFNLRERKTSSIVNTYSVFICSSDYSGTIPTVNEVVRLDTVSTRSLSGGYDWSTIPFNVNVRLYIPPQSNAEIGVSGGWVNQNVPFVQEDGSPCTGTNPIYLPTIYMNCVAENKLMVVTNEKRSGCYFTLNDLWNNEVNLFNEIIKYCKMYRIGIFADNVNKKIIFKPFIKYFENYSITDWSDKIDMSKDFTIVPVTFDKKYVLFNYKDDKDRKLCKDYKEKYGINYGEYRLSTDYNFNVDTIKLFDDTPISIVSTDNIISFIDLFKKDIIYTVPDELYIYNQDKDKKERDIFGSFYFHNGVLSFASSSHLNHPFITDDSKLQMNYQTYMYTAILSDRIFATSYPNLDIVCGDNACVFNMPKENYTYNNNYANKNSIYKNLWEDYINERYNIQNKVITCYAYLRPNDWNNFEHNKFVLVGNQICMVNKIYDYDVTTVTPTKVDLITILDVSAYTTNNYTY